MKCITNGKLLMRTSNAHAQLLVENEGFHYTRKEVWKQHGRPPIGKSIEITSQEKEKNLPSRISPMPNTPSRDTYEINIKRTPKIAPEKV